MIAATIGHNSGGFTEYWQLRMAVWDSKEPLVVKAMALAILEYMRPDNLEAPVSRRRIMEMCGISENTLERHWNAITQWIEVIKAKGRASVYRARIHACASELVEMIPAKLPAKIGGSHERVPPIEVAPTAGVPPIEYPTERGVPEQTTPHAGGYTTPNSGGELSSRAGVPPIEYPPAWGVPEQTTPHAGGYTTPNSGGDSSSRANKDNNYNYPSREEEEEEGARARKQPLVYANGTAFEGPGFRLEYALVDLNGTLAGFSLEKSRMIGELIALEWANSGFKPKAAAPAFRQAMANRRVAFQVADSKLKQELESVKASAAQTPQTRTSPQYQRQQPAGSQDAALAVMRDIAAREARKAREASQC